MPSKSKSQQRFMGMVRAAQKGGKPASPKVAKVAKSIDRDDAEDFASTKHKGLPKKVKKETKVRSLIKKMVREIMTEGKFKKLTLPNDMGTKKKVSKIIKQMRLKIDKDYDVKALDTKGKVQKFFILPKHRNEFLELLIKNNIKVRG